MRLLICSPSSVATSERFDGPEVVQPKRLSGVAVAPGLENFCPRARALPVRLGIHGLGVNGPQPLGTLHHATIASNSAISERKFSKLGHSKLQQVLKELILR